MPNTKIKNNIYYKEIQKRYFYILEDEGKAIITSGTPEDHVHVELNFKEAKKLHKWLDEHIKRKIRKARKKLGL